MAEPSEINAGNLWRLEGKVARTREMSTNLTPDEERQIMAAAAAQGKALGEWAREVLLDGVMAASRGEMEMHIFTELVGIEVLLMNALEPLLRGLHRYPVNETLPHSLRTPIVLSSPAPSLTFLRSTRAL
jgi:hypothetical protein